ncbi:condensation domain-containing protein, partial [Paenibacillus elgii]
YRIELGEIEAALLMHEEVRSAVVLAREHRSGDKYLCAYVECGKELGAQALKTHLKAALPDYMVPAHIVRLDEMPRLSSGKIDREALPVSDDDSQLNDEDYAAPCSETETLMAEIWQEVLGYRPIGTNHNFFELGGDSIKAIRISSRLSKHGLHMEIKELFRHQTIGSLAPRLKTAGIRADQGIVEGEAKLSPIQQWFFERRFTDMHHWNQAIMLYSQNGFRKDILDRVLRKLTEHHDALRMTYKAERGGIVPVIYGMDKDAYSFTVADVRNKSRPEETIRALADNLQRRMNLEQGPLVQVGLFQTLQGDHLLIAIHHLVVDGISWRIMAEDLEQGYLQALRNEEIRFQSKTHSWQEWTRRLHDDADSSRIVRHKRYWAELVGQTNKPLRKDRSAADRKSEDLDTVSVRLTGQQTDSLLTDVHQAYGTDMNDLLLTAFGMALRDWTGDEQFFIMLEGHGREPIFDDVDMTRTVGWFTTMYPILLDMQHRDDLPFQIKSVKESLRRIPNKGIDYGILNYITSSELKDDLLFKLQPEIRFNYHGQIDSSSVSSLFVESELSAGRTVGEKAEAPFALDINGSIEKGVLTLTIEYSRREFEAARIQRLGALLQERLLETIAHCVKKEEKEWTPADVGSEELSIEEFDEILAYYKK